MLWISSPHFIVPGESTGQSHVQTWLPRLAVADRPSRPSAIGKHHENTTGELLPVGTRPIHRLQTASCLLSRHGRSGRAGLRPLIPPEGTSTRSQAASQVIRLVGHEGWIANDRHGKTLVAGIPRKGDDSRWSCGRVGYLRMTSFDSSLEISLPSFSEQSAPDNKYRARDIARSPTAASPASFRL